ncbi:hypothetical protein D7V97_10655 [Corallococcus sp. CA053C]|uniref:hypothetical protein n=1 Tax=Corallococcus sp. CA053C TaxID=2316732 RepID=UPI000EA246F4|nr:hypothetical protein [Corallococcus sp. CA053C]RKH11639.1 hypothetical protein D7V97_10655 [Corallococcus sp. CA053C]
MAAVAPAAPLLAFGPPGWIAFGIVVVGTTVAAVYVANEAAERTFPRTIADTDTKTRTKCPEDHRGRVQAQGGGLEKSLPWMQPMPPPAAQGVALAGAVYAMLTKREKEERATAFAQLTRWVLARPPAGVSAVVKMSFPKPALRGGIRMDVEVLAGKAFNI